MRVTHKYTDYTIWSKAAKKLNYTIRGPFIIAAKIYEYAAYDNSGYKQGEFDDFNQYGILYEYKNMKKNPFDDFKIPDSHFFTVLFHGPKNSAISEAARRKIPFEVLEAYKNLETERFETIGKVSGNDEFALKKWEKTGEVKKVDYQKISLNPVKKKIARAFDARKISKRKNPVSEKIAHKLRKAAPNVFKKMTDEEIKRAVKVKKNPGKPVSYSETLYFIFGRTNAGSGYLTDHKTLTDKISDAIHFTDKKKAYLKMDEAEKATRWVKWEVVPITTHYKKSK
jgi:hypothetical protein